MTSSLTGLAIVSFLLAIAVTQVVGHYRRAHLREQVLRQNHGRYRWHMHRHQSSRL
jgi:type II secretory pathway pseudopilin PulG